MPTRSTSESQIQRRPHHPPRCQPRSPPRGGAPATGTAGSCWRSIGGAGSPHRAGHGPSAAGTRRTPRHHGPERIRSTGHMCKDEPRVPVDHPRVLLPELPATSRGTSTPCHPCSWPRSRGDAARVRAADLRGCLVQIRSGAQVPLVVPGNHSAAVIRDSNGTCAPQLAGVGPVSPKGSGRRARGRRRPRQGGGRRSIRGSSRLGSVRSYVPSPHGR